MAPDDSIDRESLSSNTVAGLREICKERGLLVSGRKSELVDRILEDAGIVDDAEGADPEPVMEEAWSDEDALVMEEEEDDQGDTRDKVDKVLSRLAEVVEAEIVEAEVEPATPSESSAPEEPIVLGEDDQPSLVISMPTLSSLGDRWKALAAITMVVILVGAASIVFLQRSSGFTSEQLRYGDSMEFQVIDSSISVTGEEMLGLVRDSTGGIMDEACEELTVQMSGVGDVSVTDGPESGGVGTTDSLGREGFIAVEKKISMDLDADFEGRTWRDDAKTDCGNIRWVMSDNELYFGSTSWIELEKEDLKRADSQLSFSDIDSVTTNLRAVTYDASGIGGLGALVPTLSFPLTPIELHDFFGEAVIKEGARSSDPDLNWNSDWNWEVKKEVSDSTHGLVYPVEMAHEDIGRCYGHATVSLLVKKGSPWPVYQRADILLDKDLQTSDCDFLVSTLSDEILPEGTLAIGMTLSRTSYSSGSTVIDWGRDYIGSPSDGEDRPGSAKENWVDSIRDESEIRQFDIEDAISCLKEKFPTNPATLALDTGGYIWAAEWSRPTGEAEWNLSWVDDDDDSGWLVLRRSSEGCEILSSGSNDRDEVSWNRDSIPKTQSLSLLEERILTEGRYPDLSQHIQSGDSWNLEAEVGYRLSVTEENEFLNLLPGDLGDGKVAMTTSRDWETGGRDNSLEMAMDAETGEMVMWYVIDRPTD